MVKYKIIEKSCFVKCFNLSLNRSTEILCEAVYIGIDAGLKSQVLHYPDGITMIGGQIAK